jgi:tetratricopeptide (TPR) repeat protein
MDSLTLPDLHYARAAQGWLELGDHLEANEELEKITPQMRAHPDVLEIRWQIYAKEKKWEACIEIARAITQIEPGRPSGWIHYAYSTRRATNGGLEAAKTVLLSVNEKFPQIPVIPYNLACYYCQLGDLKGAWDWLERAFDIGDPKQLKLMALDDPDLKQLWPDISEI